jgi:hypothetical protein
LYEWFGFRRTGERQAILRFDLYSAGVPGGGDTAA